MTAKSKASRKSDAAEPAASAEAERKRNAARGGRIKGSGEITDLKEQLRTLVADVLDGKVATGVGAVVNQILNTRLRAIEQERKLRELEELAGRLEALEEVLRARKAG